MNKYGNPPKDLGEIHVHLPEVMYYLYLPVKLADSFGVALPANLDPIKPLIDAVLHDVIWGDHILYDQTLENLFIYVTVKKMFVGNGQSPNRPGWHCDGFGTEDLNYVWYDSVPTLFNVSDDFNITEHDHVLSLQEFDQQARECNNVVYPCGHLLRLDSSVVHRVADPPSDQIMRTFIKISVSRDKYNLKDNSINHELNYNWKTYDRAMVRNDPAMAQKDSFTPVVVDDHLI